MADAVDVSRAKDYVETAAVTDAEVAEETATVVEKAVEEFDDLSSKIKDKSADHEIDLTEANNLLEERDTEAKELMEDIMNEEDTEPPISLVDKITDEMKCNKVTDKNGTEMFKASVARMITGVGAKKPEALWTSVFA